MTEAYHLGDKLLVMTSYRKVKKSTDIMFSFDHEVTCIRPGAIVIKSSNKERKSHLVYFSTFNCLELQHK